MQAVILCGGLGTRLREETEFRPKPMVEIGGKPILWHIMKHFAHYGINDFVLCVGYLGDVIKEYFLNYEAFNNPFTVQLANSGEIHFHGRHLESDWRVTVVDTGLETSTGGRVKLIEPFINSDTFCVTYGDGLADIDLAELIGFHQTHGKTGTLSAVRPLSRFGIVDLSSSSEVVRFREKPQSDDWVAGGFFVFNRGFFSYLDEGSTLETAPLERLTKDQQLMAFKHEGFWQPMDTYREWQLLSELWRTNQAPWKVWGRD